MPRRKAISPATQPLVSVDAEVIDTPNPTAEVGSVSQSEPEQQAAPSEETRIKLGPDPYPLKTVSLGSDTAGPKMHLQRSRKYRQMQMRFERDPDDKYKHMLARAGWRDRTEEEGVWTKQLPKDGPRWQAAAEAERLFKEIANGIRAEQGLTAALSL